MEVHTQAEIKGKGLGGWLSLWTREGGDLWRPGPPVPVVLGEKNPVAPSKLLIASAAVGTRRFWAKFPSLPFWNPLVASEPR